jgi:hypothetical protein
MDIALFIAGFAEVVVLIVVIAGAVGGKNEPDPRAERPLGIYLAAALVVATFTAFAGVGLTASAVNHLAEKNSGHSVSSFDDEFSFESASSGGDAERNREITELVTAVVVLAAGAAVFLFHDPKLRALAQNSDGPGLRVADKVAYILCFSALVALIVAAAATVFALYASVAPGVAGNGDRDEALRGLIIPASLLLAAIGIFRVNWGRVPKRLLATAPSAPA